MTAIGLDPCITRSSEPMVLATNDIGFNRGVLGLAENPAQGTGFWSQNTEGHDPMSLHCNTAIIVFKLLVIVE